MPAMCEGCKVSIPLTESYCGECESPKNMKMSALTKELQARGIKATFEMSGGNCGTIYLGEFNEEGYAEFAIGPSNYSLDEAYFEELCWGIDGEESATYYTGTSEDFTPAKVADLIATDYEKVRK